MFRVQPQERLKGKLERSAALELRVRATCHPTGLEKGKPDTRSRAGGDLFVRQLPIPGEVQACATERPAP